MQVELFDVTAREPMKQALAIRRCVFVEEQGVPLEEEADEHDSGDLGAVHALATLDRTAVGAGRFFALDAESVQIGRMAVLPGARGRGAGRAILDALVREARRLGFRRACLLAQVHAVTFYAAAGFVPRGERVTDAGILHEWMEKSLARD
jgi:predicted GNAT family N-acyltransferase